MDVFDIANLVKNKFTDWSELGRVNVTKQPNGLWLFNYTRECQYQNSWNDFELLSRGLLISDDGEIVARPFPKFFNYGQEGCPDLSKKQLVSVTNKEDGSLGILYRHNGRLHISTRGSTISDQAIWATNYLWDRYPNLVVPNECTLLFEIIAPLDLRQNLVTKYQHEGLYLLAAINRFTGNEMDAKPFSFTKPKTYPLTTIDDVNIWAKTATNTEGAVLLYADGTRVKIKTQEYLALHKTILGLSRKNIISMFFDNTLDLTTIPDEFDPLVQTVLAEIKSVINDVISQYQPITTNVSRKEYAMLISTKDRYLHPIYWGAYDGRDLQPITHMVAKRIMSR